MNRDDVLVLLSAVATAVLIVILAVAVAGAAEIACPKSIKCWQVKAAVATFGEAAAESHVRACGWTDAKIAEARKCLR